MITVLSSFGFVLGVGFDAGAVVGFAGVALVETDGVGRLGPEFDTGAGVLASPLFEGPTSEFVLRELMFSFDWLTPGDVGSATGVCDGEAAGPATLLVE